MKLNSKALAIKPKISAIVPSLILEAITIEGDIYGEGGLEIEGKVRGNVRCLSVTIGVNAIVHGNIVAEKVEVYGEVMGSITAKKIICGATAKVRGDILHSTIHIENGAHVDGSCRKFVPTVFEPNALLENQENLVMTEELEQVVAAPVQEKPREPEIHQDEVIYFDANTGEPIVAPLQVENPNLYQQIFEAPNPVEYPAEAAAIYQHDFMSEEEHEKQDA